MLKTVFRWSVVVALFFLIILGVNSRELAQVERPSRETNPTIEFGPNWIIYPIEFSPNRISSNWSNWMSYPINPEIRLLLRPNGIIQITSICAPLSISYEERKQYGKIISVEQLNQLLKLVNLSGWIEEEAAISPYF